MSRRTLVIIALIAVGGIGWYLFRPERLFVNQTVNEAAPEVAVLGGNSPSASLAALASGQFHSNAHETRGTRRSTACPTANRSSG